ncbi:exosome complex component RRP46 [Diprion similis]|uniref:exosome complex component RRP46 n=1 Tax=Diprion similis TaxID=362088 RepID=UPI001EF9B1EB|nr:exosome complex component RRP46 [Diprion similis]
MQKQLETMEEEECILRPMNCELNQLSRPDGSTMFMQGDTVVVAGIYGPIEAKLQKMMHDRATVETIFSPAKGPPCVDDRLKETVIKETCEAVLLTALHPGMAISINVQELQDSGGLLACAINAACLALMNSSISMKFTVAAVSCMIDRESGKLIIDPDSTQIQHARVTFTYVFEGIKKDLVSCHTTGRFSENELMESLEKCRAASQNIFNFYRNIVEQYAIKL